MQAGSARLSCAVAGERSAVSVHASDPAGEDRVLPRLSAGSSRRRARVDREGLGQGALPGRSVA